MKIKTLYLIFNVCFLISKKIGKLHSEKGFSSPVYREKSIPNTPPRITVVCHRRRTGREPARQDGDPA